jgi:hypothetical protein
VQVYGTVSAQTQQQRHHPSMAAATRRAKGPLVLCMHIDCYSTREAQQQRYDLSVTIPTCTPKSLLIPCVHIDCLLTLQT